MKYHCILVFLFWYYNKLHYKSHHYIIYEEVGEKMIDIVMIFIILILYAAMHGLINWSSAVVENDTRNIKLHK